MKDTLENKIAANTVNAAGGAAYQMSKKHSLAQVVSTACLNGTYYTSAKEQVDMLLSLAEEIHDPEFVGKVAIYGHNIAGMKDTPAALCAWLAHKDVNVLAKIFSQVIDDGGMLRKFCQFVRCGKFGRRSFGTIPRNLIRGWFSEKDGNSIFRQSIGNSPSLGDVIKMVHPTPENDEKAALYAYLIGAQTVEGHLCASSHNGQTRRHPITNLPEVVQSFEQWKQDTSLPLPKLHHLFLSGQKLSKTQWKDIALAMNWRTTLKNLNTLVRHGCFDDAEVVEKVASRLSNEESILKSKGFPYEIMTAYFNAVDWPERIREALHDAMEVATRNTPYFEGELRIMVDVSGSMVNGIITGNQEKDNAFGRHRKSSVMHCVDVAALMAASLLRRNPSAKVTCFANTVKPELSLDPEMPIMKMAEHIRKNAAGGTDCSAPLAKMNAENDHADMVIYISDYESWFDTAGHHRTYRYSDPAKMHSEWLKFKERNPSAKLACIDLTPRTNCQVQQREDIVQIGGFSDHVFDVVDRFNLWGWGTDHWVNEIEAIVL